MMHEPRILIVCNANMCRSPLAEWILRTRLREQHIAAEVSSAGVLFEGRPATDKSAEVVSDRGGNIESHRSRIIDEEMIREQDLVLTMERNLVRRIWELSPDLLGRTFTLKSFVNLADKVGPRHADASLEDWLAEIDGMRDPAELAGRSDADDVKDPIGQSIRRYRAVAEELDALITTFIDLTWPDEFHRLTITPPAEPTGKRDRSASPLVSSTVADDLTVIEFDDHGANRLTAQVCDAIDLALDEAERDSRVVVLAGRTGVFATSSESSDDDQPLAELLLRLHGFPLPVVAACSGTARGTGASLLLATDLRIGVRGDHLIGFDVLERGLPLDSLSIELARDRLARTALVPSILLGTPWTASRAVEAGFLDHLVEADDLVGEVAKRARSLAGRLASGAFVQTRRRMRGPLLAYLHDEMSRSF